MKILLIGNYAADQQYSMQGFAGTLKTGLADRGSDVRLIAPQPRLSRAMPIRGAGKWLGYFDKFVLFPPEMKRAMAWADLVHVCDQGNATYVRYLQRKPHLLTCHDVLAIRSALGELPDWPTGFTGRIYQRLILQGLNQTKHVVCVSEATRRDVLRLTGLTPPAVGLIYNGLYQQYLPMPEVESAPLLGQMEVPTDRPFFLHVGGNQPYKNRPMVLEIFRRLRQEAATEGTNLVLAGKPLPPSLRDAISRPPLSGYVLERANLSNEQLRALYSRAAGLIFPSLYEGFGLPIIEAQASGCPVFTSNRDPMVEIGGEAAKYFDPMEPAEATRLICDNMDALPSMVEAGFHNVRRFTRDQMLTHYLETYERILNGPSRHAS